MMLRGDKMPGHVVFLFFAGTDREQHTHIESDLSRWGFITYQNRTRKNAFDFYFVHGSSDDLVKS